VLINKAKLLNHHPQVNDYREDKSGQKRTSIKIIAVEEEKGGRNVKFLMGTDPII
jgi:hypothetical protein